MPVRFWSAFVVLYVALLISMKASENSKEAILQLDMQSGFSGSKVILAIDGRIELSQDLTTHSVTGIAGRLTYKTNKKQACITIKCLDINYTTNVKMSRGVYVGISIKDHKIVITQSQTPYFYD